MIQNNLQINPGNRVDFSRLRKYKPGGNIHKFQNPNQPIQMTQAQLDTRKRDWPFPVSDGWITNGQYDYAKMYKYYKEHPEEFKDLSQIKATPTWEGEQTIVTPSGTTGTPSGSTGITSGATGVISGTVGTDFTPVTYEPPFKYKGDPFTSPITSIKLYLSSSPLNSE